jgi:hypothetical protein
MAIEIKPEKKESSLVQDIFLVISLVCIIISFGTYIYYANVVIPQKESQLRELNTVFGSLTEADLKQKEQDLALAQKYIEDFKILLQNNPKSSKFFDAFQSWAHPKITYSGTTLSVQNKSVNMMGSTNGFRNIMEQIAILEREPTIENFDITNVNLSDNGGVTFNLDIILKADLLK